MGHKRLTSTVATPPGGWRYSEIRSRADFTGGSLEDLIRKVKAHYVANPNLFEEISDADLRQKIIDWICENVADVSCRENGLSPTPKVTPRKCCGRS